VRKTGPASYKKAKFSHVSSSLSGSYTPMSTASRALARRVEVKQFTTPFNAAPIGPTGMLTACCGAIQQGDAGDNREGRVVRLLDLYYAFDWRAPSTTTNVAQGDCRILILQWKPSTGAAAPSIGDFITSYGPILIADPWNLNSAPNFKCLSDKTYCMPPTGISGQVTAKFIQGRCKVNCEQSYPSGTGALAAQENTIYILALTTSFYGTHLNGTVTTRFIDV